jgi:hypothetical protein
MAIDRLLHPIARGFFSVAAVIALLGCGPSSHPPTEHPTTEVVRADFGVESYLPLIDNTVLSFETETEGSAERGLLVMQVRRPRPTLVELKVGGKTRRLDLLKDGVRVVESGWLLKRPLEVGATFTGQYGTVKVTRVNLTVVVPAGKFEGCVETEETTGTSRTMTRFCPTIGITELEVEALSTDAPGREIAKLKSFGPLVDLGKDQLQVSPQ